MWNYSSETKTSAGYESVLDQLKAYTKEDYLESTEDCREEIKSEVLAIYRSINIFPITYYNEQGIHDEIKKCIDKEVSFEDNLLDLKFNQGQSLCRFLFPNLAKVDVGIAKNNSMYDRFYDDHKLKRAIDFCLRFKKSVTPAEMRTALEMIGGGVATNFKAMNAKALYERYVPKNGFIYDYAAGFGGRMLGALSSKNNYTYYGVDPNTETFDNLNRLGKEIEKVAGRTNSFRVYCKGSEDFRPKNGEGMIDFAFSSPPYFNLEQYTDEPTQCYNKFPTLEEWYEGYVKTTINNIHYMLKNNAYYAVNIADFNVGKDRIEFVDKWIELSEELGFEYVEQIHMKLTTRRGVGHKDEDGKNKDKKEGIFVFRKVTKSV